MTDQVAIANSFNDYFINVGKSLAHNIVSRIDPLTYIDKSKNCITDVAVTVNDVKTIVSQLNNSAAGPDDLPASIMKQVSHEYCIPSQQTIKYRFCADVSLLVPTVTSDDLSARDGYQFDYHFNMIISLR